MKRIQYNIAVFFLVLASMQAQDGMVNNKGVMTVKPQSVVGVKGTFTNHTSGDVINDGEIHFFNDFTNNGLFSYTTNTTTGYVVFSGNTGAVQNISGNSPSFFYDVMFNKAQQTSAFHITNETTYAGTVNLFNGVVVVDEQADGAFIFLPGSTHINARNESHIKGEVIKEGNDAFTYPIGDGSFYRMASISAPAHRSDSYSGEYLFENTEELFPHESRTGVIEYINKKEYWKIFQKNPSKENIWLTLSWDQNTTDSELLASEEEMRIVRWDENQKLWVDEGGVVDVASKTVTTLAPVEGYGVFTLGKAQKKWLQPGDLVIYNGVTPNGDDMNDYFIIDNIQLYPKNTVRIYNRWGKEVFFTESYDSNGNVFKGIAEGKGVIGKGTQLPSGTYYYVLEYFVNENGVERLVKRVGYLHLETN